jgi:hypothetical protein
MRSNGLGLTWPIFFESAVEDFPLGVREHEIALLDAGAKGF